MREILFWTTLLILSPLLLAGAVAATAVFGLAVDWGLADEFHNYIAED